MDFIFLPRRGSNIGKGCITSFENHIALEYRPDSRDNRASVFKNVIPSRLMAFDKSEAEQLLKAEIQKYRQKSYDDLKAMMTGPINYDIVAPSKSEYQVEVEAFWDVPKTPGNIRVLIRISGQTFMSSIMPLSDSFILSPTGSFIGE